MVHAIDHKIEIWGIEIWTGGPERTRKHSTNPRQSQRALFDGGKDFFLLLQEVYKLKSGLRVQQIDAIVPDGLGFFKTWF